MFKKLFVLAAACVFSLSASAAWVQYDISNVTYADDPFNAFSGSFVQDSHSGGIVWFNLATLSNRFIPNFDSTIIGVSNYVPGQPTGFIATSSNNGVNDSMIGLSFMAGPAPGTFALAPNSFETYLETFSSNPPVTHQILSGTVTVGTIEPHLLAYLENPNSGLTVFLPPNSPASVPEPGSLALIGAGLALIGRLRKRARQG
ncbi:PEP-CTERM sorting domain-containing protein [Massilia rhizosphaerae]|uniref:PEP-CTERM sorting domain-containing protein n=1 Tax=Massilia rhizosphaerae TaxID=2784389 RepID=UPI0018DB6D73|nr:PEP-CTERM sorting domain-containing protein [Massilia rhizosphaerae]